MSLGTSLRPLLAAGIRPDFHIEVENTEDTADAVAASTAGFDTADITLVVSLTVHPRVARTFRRAMYFVRERMGITLLFGRGYEPLRPSGPTVANAGLAVALRLGFREIYFLGMDMGSKVAGKFHAAGTIYATGQLRDPGIAQERLPGNFGGDVTAIGARLGQPVLNWSRHMIESVLAANPDLRIYNCSDGARIAGALPRLSSTVTLTGAAIDRNAFRDGIGSALDMLTLAAARHLWERARPDADALFVEARELVAAELAAPEPGFGWTDRVFELVRPDDGQNAVLKAFLSGSVMLLMGTATWYDRHLVDANDSGSCGASSRGIRGRAGGRGATLRSTPDRRRAAQRRAEAAA
jgi:hypothetical protein